MNVGVFHPGTQHSWQTATALQDLGRLEWFATTIFYRPDRFPFTMERLIPGKLGEKVRYEFRRFDHPRLDPAKVHTTGAWEWVERAVRRLGAHGLAERIDMMGNAAFARDLRKLVSAPQPFAIWGYDGVSRDVFRMARDAGRPIVLDRTIGDLRTQRDMLELIAQTHGDWILPHEGPSAARIAMDDEEYSLADRIVCGSRFAADSVREKAADPAVAAKVRVLPYCFDESLFGQLPPPAPIAPGEPVRFLFAGRIWPAKGIQHVLEAMADIPASQATLTVVGTVFSKADALAPYAGRFEHIPQVPRSGMPELMARHHVLVLPSYFEGSALVLYEAMAAGLATIQTPNAGGNVDAATGILLPRPDTDLVREAMLSLIDYRDRLNAMRAAAQEGATAYSFARYRDNIAALLDEMAI